MAKADNFGKNITISRGNVSSRVLPVKIHDLDSADTVLLENELGGPVRSVNFIYKSAGVNRPLRADEDNASSNLNKTFYRDQINKVANAVKEIIQAMEHPAAATSSSVSFRTVEERSPDPARRNKRLSVVAVAGLLAAVIFYLLFYFLVQRSSPPPDKSIAVIPFTDLSQAHDQEYFGDGMMAEIISHLSRIADLQVISRTSAMKYKGSLLSVNEIAKELGVSNILSGTVQKSGDQIRISVELTDGRNNKNLWSEEYERKLKDIFSIQTDVSTRVTEILKARLTPQEKGSLSKSYTDNPQAYKLYLKGRYFWDKRNKVSFDSAEVYFKRAIDVDPGYALAYSGLADCYIIVPFRGTQLENLPIANSYVKKALSIDSTLGEAWTTVGFIRSHIEFDWKGSRPIFEKAIRLNPNYSLAHLFYANMFFYPGDKERGMTELKKALDLDPLSTTLNYVLGRRYYELREYDRAIRQLQKSLTLTPDYPAANIIMGFCFVQMKKYKQAADAFHRLPAAEWDREVMLSYAYAMGGDKPGAKALLDKTTKEEKITSHYLLALAYIGLENTNEALAQLEQAYEARDIWMITLKIYPVLDPIRNEPRFKALMKKINLE